MKEEKIIKASLLKIFMLNGYTDSSKMTQRDFEYISTVIEKKSGIVISSTTIKRLSKGEFSRLPQIATLNAMANYFGFTNWQEYKSSEELGSEAATLNKEASNATTAKRSLSRFTWGVLIVPFLAVVFLMSKDKNDF